MKRAGKAARRAGRDRRAFAGAACGAAALVLFAGLLMWLPPAGSARLQIGGPFRLVADNGSIVTDRSFPGKYLLIYFGYTTCRDICPATLNSLGAAIGRLGARAAHVQPLFITVDPARDTPQVLRHYVQAFASGLIGLTGPAPELRKVADEYQVSVMSHPMDSAIDHGAVLYLMAPDGRFVAPIATGTTDLAMAQAISRHID